MDTHYESEERGRPESAPSSEQSRYRPRFRVVTRRPLPAPPLPADPMHRATLVAAVPALCLLAYVLCWTLAMRGGYYREQIRTEIQALRIEQAELEAEKRRLQSPGYILQRAAAELKMQPASVREFSELPGNQTVAAGRTVLRLAPARAEAERVTR